MTGSCALVQAARLTLVQILINSKGLNMNPLQSLYYVSPACMLCLLFPFGKVLASRTIAVKLAGAPSFSVCG